MADKSLRDFLISAVVIVGVCAGITLGANKAFNSYYKENPNSKTFSRTIGTLGHKEYTKYRDGSSDLKVYPAFWGHRLVSSNLYQDLDGDGKVDRIRINSPEWKFHRLKKSLIREYDYESNKEEFDEGDKLLSEEKVRYTEKVK